MNIGSVNKFYSKKKIQYSSDFLNCFFTRRNYTITNNATFSPQICKEKKLVSYKTMPKNNLNITL